jgi:hypothetical protein
MNGRLSGTLAGPSVPTSLTAVAILLGDAFVILGFIATGIHSHGGIPWQTPQYTLETFAPFLIAWLLLSPLLGVYHPRTLTDYPGTALHVTLTWVGTAILGALVRSTSFFHGSAPLSFVVPITLLGVLFFLPWRLFTVLLTRRVGTSRASNRARSV